MKIEKWQVVAAPRFVGDAAYLQVSEEQVTRWAERLEDDPLAGFPDQPDASNTFGRYEVAGYVIWYLLASEQQTVRLLRLRAEDDDRRSTVEKVIEEGGKVKNAVNEVIGILGSVKGD